MKNIFFSLVLCSPFLLSIFSCANVEGDVNDKKEINKENIVVADYKVEGMVCAMGCAKTIQDELASVNGVAQCKVDFESGNAHVEYDKEQLSEGDIISLIESMADGQYKVSKEDVGNDRSIEDSKSEKSTSSDNSVSEVSFPSFEIPNLFELLFKQL